MNAELKQYESRLATLLNQSPNDREGLYNLAVETGRYLQANKLENFRPAIFTHWENRRSLQIELKAKTEELERLLLSNVRMAVKAAVSKGRPWTVSTDPLRPEKSELKDEVVNKYLVQYLVADQDRDGGDFSVEFEVRGALKEVFDHADVPTAFAIELSNSSGANNESIYTIDGTNALTSCRGPVDYTDQKWTVATLSEFVDAVSKQCMFILLSES